MAKAKTKTATEGPPPVRVVIEPPNLRTAELVIRGTAPYVQNKFSTRAMTAMMVQQKAGSQSAKGKKRAPRDFDRDYKAAMHVAEGGWHGVPSSSLRNAMIAACRLVGFKMTHAKLSVFILPDGFDADDGTPLTRIRKGKPRKHVTRVRNATGVMDLRARPMWSEGWEATVRIEYDADQFSLEDVANLLMRAGRQVGIGAGRPGSRESNGVGWGVFTIAEEKPSAKRKR